MLSGKAHAGTRRAYFLVQSALERSKLQLILPLGLINSYQHKILTENIYVLLVIEMMDSFQMK